MSTIFKGLWETIKLIFQKKQIVETQKEIKENIKVIQTHQIPGIQKEVIQLREHTHDDFKEVSNEVSLVRNEIVRSSDKTEQQLKLVVANSENVIRLEVSSLEKQLSNQVFELERMNQELNFKNRQLETNYYNLKCEYIDMKEDNAVLSEKIDNLTDRYTEALNQIENLENPLKCGRGFGMEF